LGDRQVAERLATLADLAGACEEIDRLERRRVALVVAATRAGATVSEVARLTGWSRDRVRRQVARHRKPADEDILDVTITANVLANYVGALRAESDEAWRARIVLHDFGMVWQHAGAAERQVLVADEPEPFDVRWDAFLAAYVEYLCHHADLPAPQWVFDPGRHLGEFWFPGPRFPRERAAVILTTPAAFEAHGIWFPARELEVV